VLQREAVIHGVLDAVILRFNEARREDAERSAWWDDRQSLKIERGLGVIEQDCAAYRTEGTILPIALGCLLGFMERTDQALVTYDWRGAHPEAAAWYDGFAGSPLMTETASIP
jgi:glutathione S-transferase